MWSCSKDRNGKRFKLLFVHIPSKASADKGKGRLSYNSPRLWPSYVFAYFLVPSLMRISRFRLSYHATMREPYLFKSIAFPWCNYYLNGKYLWSRRIRVDSNKREQKEVSVCEGFFFFFTLIFKQKTGSRQEENSIARWVLKWQNGKKRC